MHKWGRLPLICLKVQLQRWVSQSMNYRDYNKEMELQFIINLTCFKLIFYRLPVAQHPSSPEWSCVYPLSFHHRAKMKEKVLRIHLSCLVTCQLSNPLSNLSSAFHHKPRVSFWTFHRGQLSKPLSFSALILLAIGSLATSGPSQISSANCQIYASVLFFLLLWPR